MTTFELYRTVFQVPREKVALLRYLLEAEDGLAAFHVSSEGVVSLSCPNDRREELEDWMREHRALLGLSEG